MAHVKYSARRASCQGRRARFGAPTRAAAWNQHYQLHLQPRRNWIPSDDEEAPLPTPPVEAVVNFWNGGCPLPAPSPVGPSIRELLKDLDVSDEATPGEESPASQVPVPMDAQVVVSSPARMEDTLSMPPRSPFKADMIEDLLVPSPAETVLYDGNMNLIPAVTSEAVSETSLPQAPVMIAKSVTATHTASPEPEVQPTKDIVTRPCQPTAAVKCPRKQFRPRKVERAEPPPHPKKKSLSALQEIRKWQTRVDPLLPLTPFTALVREFIKEWGNFRITRDAVLALRCGTEQYLVDTLQGANLLCMHRDRCTLQPKDVRMARRVRGEDDTVGITEEAQEGIHKNFREYHAKSISLIQAVRVETQRRRKLCQMAKNHWQAQRRAVNARIPVRSWTDFMFLFYCSAYCCLCVQILIPSLCSTGPRFITLWVAREWSMSGRIVKWNVLYLYLYFWYCIYAHLFEVFKLFAIAPPICNKLYSFVKHCYVSFWDWLGTVKGLVRENITSRIKHQRVFRLVTWSFRVNAVNGVYGNEWLWWVNPSLHTCIYHALNMQTLSSINQ